MIRAAGMILADEVGLGKTIGALGRAPGPLRRYAAAKRPQDDLEQDQTPQI